MTARRTVTFPRLDREQAGVRDVLDASAAPRRDGRSARSTSGGATIQARGEQGSLAQDKY